MRRGSALVATLVFAYRFVLGLIMAVSLLGFGLSIGGVQDGPDTLPPKLKIADDFRTVGGEFKLNYCPSSDNICMGCYTHAKLEGCTECTYLDYYRVNPDGSVTCVWVAYRALKNFR